MRPIALLLLTATLTCARAAPCVPSPLVRQLAVKLGQELSEEPLERRRAAARWLFEFGPFALPARAALVAAIDDPDREVRFLAIGALAGGRQAMVTPTWTRPAMRLPALPEAVIGRLLARLPGQHAERRALLNALRLSPRFALVRDALIAALRDPAPTAGLARIDAAHALGHGRPIDDAAARALADVSREALRALPERRVQRALSGLLALRSLHAQRPALANEVARQELPRLIDRWRQGKLATYLLQQVLLESGPAADAVSGRLIGALPELERPRDATLRSRLALLPGSRRPLLAMLATGGEPARAIAGWYLAGMALSADEAGRLLALGLADLSRCDALIAALDADDRHPASGCFRQLPALEPSALQTLRAALRAPQQRAGALALLACLGDRGAALATPLARLLVEPGVSRRAVDAALRSVGPAGRDALRAMTHDDRAGWQRAAREALRRIRW